MIKTIIICIFIAVAACYIGKGNIAVAILFSVVLLIDYHIWIAGGDTVFFKDKTQIEKDLREIQKLELKQKLDKLRKNESPEN